MSINIGGGELRELKPRILVLGVGGAGGNAINAMISCGTSATKANNYVVANISMWNGHVAVALRNMSWGY